MADNPHPPSVSKPGLSPLGSGWSFPPSFDRFSSTVKLSSDLDNVRENLHILFATDIGERIMLANYGTLLRQHVFAALSETTSNQLKLEIRNVIAEWEPRIDVLEIQINDRQESTGACELAVIFQLRTSGATGSMIYPFLLPTGEQMLPGD
jgi:phage baseplate assembly protein W